MAAERCPTHPSQPVDACAYCDARIERREIAEQDDYPDESDRDAERYERWLGRHD